MLNLISNTITATLVSAAVATAAVDYDQFIKDRDCLALNIYHEARGESIQGQIAVAQVTVNRAKHDFFPDSICDVVWQDHQFSWTNDGRSDRVRDQEAYAVALNIAEWVLLGREDDPTNGSLFYHARGVSPFWARKVDRETVIGVHVFYTWDGRW